MEAVTLQSLFPADWGAEQPSDLVALLAADYQDLDEQAKHLRALAVNLVHTHERSPILTARDAMSLLEKHHLPKRKGKWVTVALDKGKERIYEKNPRGGLRLVQTVTTRFPSIKNIDSDISLQPGQSLLLIYGGGPAVLKDDESLSTYRAVRTVRPIADIVLWDDDGQAATFWSVGAGKGMRGSQALDFPDKEDLSQWQTS